MRSLGSKFDDHAIRVTIAALALLVVPASGLSQEELGFIAEHMIETQMDARYMSLPKIEMTTENRIARFDVGYLAASGGPFTSSAAMLGVQRFMPMPHNDRWAFVLGGFLDLIRFDGSNDGAIIDPNFARPVPVVVPIDAQVLDISGDAVHAGISVAVVRRVSDTWAWQAGAMLEYYEVNELAVAFQARDPTGPAGDVDYAGNYNSITPYFTLRHVYPRRSERFEFASRLLVAWPLPRRGFKGRISGPGFDIEGDSEAVGLGRHIPDGFAGVGFDVASTQRRWRIDVGASLWLLLAENKAHEGVDPPLFVNFSIPFD